jgi:hypothetical protein
LLRLPCFELRPQGRLDLDLVVEAAGVDGAMAIHAALLRGFPLIKSQLRMSG